MCSCFMLNIADNVQVSPALAGTMLNSSSSAGLKILLQVYQRSRKITGFAVTVKIFLQGWFFNK